MPVISENFIAGVPKQFNVAGSVLLLRSASAGVDLQALKDGRPVRESLVSALAGDGMRPKDGFDTLIVTSSVTQAVVLWYAIGDVFSLRVQGEVLVDKGGSLTDIAEKTVGVASAVVATALATRQSIRWRAPLTNTDFIYLGGAGVTVANAVIALAPGEYLEESSNAAAAWSAISGTAAQKLRVLEG